MLGSLSSFLSLSLTLSLSYLGYILPWLSLRQLWQA